MTQTLDEKLGKRLREIRLMKGISQKTLAQRVGITFQQVQKYESGQNRMSASRLFTIAQRLNVPLDAFYGASQPEQLSIADERALRLMKYYHDIAYPPLQEAVTQLSKSLAEFRVEEQPAG